MFCISQKPMIGLDVLKRGLMSTEEVVRMEFNIDNALCGFRMFQNSPVLNKTLPPRPMDISNAEKHHIV